MARYEVARRIGTPNHEVRALEGIGECLIRQGHHDDGHRHLREAIAIYRRIQAPDAARVEATLARNCHNDTAPVQINRHPNGTDLPPAVRRGSPGTVTLCTPRRRPDLQAGARSWRMRLCCSTASSVAVGWCQSASPRKLPNINLRKVYGKGVDQPLDFGVTWFFVATAYRRRGVPAAALWG